MEVKSNLAVNGLGGEIGALAVELSLEKEREGLFFLYQREGLLGEKRENIK